MNKSKLFPPGTIIKIVKLWPHARKQGNDIGEVWEIGYYCKHCDADVIWLVDKKGKYSWTIDKDFLIKHFEVIKISKNRKFYSPCKVVDMENLSEQEIKQLRLSAQKNYPK